MDTRDYEERRRNTFLWGGMQGRMDQHMIVIPVGWNLDTKTGIPPKMKAETVEQWRRTREDAEIERLMGWKTS
jgi:hypothetical protein